MYSCALCLVPVVYQLPLHTAKVFFVFNVNLEKDIMAGMFYSLQEVTDRLGKSEDEVRKLIKQGKLREFRDGTKLLFKVEEVDALVADAGVSEANAASAESAIDLLSDETGQITIEPDAKDIMDASKEFDLGELSSADTNITTAGINVLAETDDEYKLADDSRGETQVDESSGDMGSLDDDINLDSVGSSGSGLLDLSLQADDTSLGAVLDDILPAAGQGGPKESDVVEEADKIFEEVRPEPVEMAAAEPGMAVRYFEPEPDAVSNACGYTLFIPLAVAIYAAIVILAGAMGVTPSILKGLEGIIWYVLIALALISGGIIGVAMLLGGKKEKTNVYQQAG